MSALPILFLGGPLDGQVAMHAEHRTVIGYAGDVGSSPRYYRVHRLALSPQHVLHVAVLEEESVFSPTDTRHVQAVSALLARQDVRDAVRAP